jgi:hypothetical protein
LTSSTQASKCKFFKILRKRKRFANWDEAKIEHFVRKYFYPFSKKTLILLMLLSFSLLFQGHYKAINCIAFRYVSKISWFDAEYL